MQEEETVLKCGIALRNLTSGALIGVLEAPAWDPGSDDPDENARDLVLKTFVAAYPDHSIRPALRSSDNWCGTFAIGPLIGLWEWLDFGEKPVEWSSDWAMDVYRQILQSQISG